jgi:hypothetical protein
MDKDIIDQDRPIETIPDKNFLIKFVDSSIDKIQKLRDQIEHIEKNIHIAVKRLKDEFNVELPKEETLSSRNWTKEILEKSGNYWPNEREFYRIYLVKFIGKGKRVTEVLKWEIRSFRLLNHGNFKSYGSIQLPIDLSFDKTKVLSMENLLLQFKGFESFCFQKGYFEKLLKKE